MLVVSSVLTLLPAPASTVTGGDTPSAAPCIAVYTPEAGSGASGGKARKSVSNLKDCEAECNSDDTCVAFDWAPKDTNTMCWVHLDIANLDNKYNNDDVTLYVKGPCRKYCIIHPSAYAC